MDEQKGKEVIWKEKSRNLLNFAFCPHQQERKKQLFQNPPPLFSLSHPVETLLVSDDVRVDVTFGLREAKRCALRRRLATIHYIKSFQEKIVAIGEEGTERESCSSAISHGKSQMRDSKERTSCIMLIHQFHLLLLHRLGSEKIQKEGYEHRHEPLIWWWFVCVLTI